MGKKSVKKIRKSSKTGRPPTKNEIKYLKWYYRFENYTALFLLMMSIVLTLGMSWLAGLAHGREKIHIFYMIGLIAVPLNVAALLWYRHKLKAKKLSGKTKTITGVLSKKEIKLPRGGRTVEWYIGENRITIPMHWLDHFLEEDQIVTAEVYRQKEIFSVNYVLSVNDLLSVDREIPLGLLSNVANTVRGSLLILLFLFLLIGSVIWYIQKMISLQTAWVLVMLSILPLIKALPYFGKNNRYVQKVKRMYGMISE